jgi:hypothetical protein
MLHLFYNKTCITDCAFPIVYRTVSLKDEYDILYGEFTISGYGVNECFDTGNTCSMSISVEEPYQHRGFTHLMVREMIECIRKDYPAIRNDQLLFIDTDASGGFWDKMGMKPHRYGDNYGSSNRHLEGKGYEKMISFYDLEQYGLNKYK